MAGEEVSRVSLGGPTTTFELKVAHPQFPLEGAFCLTVGADAWSGIIELLKFLDLLFASRTLVHIDGHAL